LSCLRRTFLRLVTISPLPAFADLSLGIPPAKSPPKPPEAAGIDDIESPPPGRIDGGDLFPLDCLGATKSVNNFSLANSRISNKAAVYLTIQLRSRTIIRYCLFQFRSFLDGFQ
jgi:hypothetical protein